MDWLTISNTGAGAFFLQPRSEKNGKIFKVIKFKTMTDKRDAQGNLLPDAKRLTKVEKFVRSMSLDEIPQLINVIKGDIALVAPRPLLVQYLPLYNDRQRRRYAVRPGIIIYQERTLKQIGVTDTFFNGVFPIIHVSKKYDESNPSTRGLGHRNIAFWENIRNNLEFVGLRLCQMVQQQGTQSQWNVVADGFWNESIQRFKYFHLTQKSQN
jgi:hypothetical protein